MVTPTAGAVVLVRFPFSDLSQTKRRPAVVLANAGRGDWILCQVTSKPYGDTKAIKLEDTDFSTGSLRVLSYARPGKLFTANRDLVISEVATLKSESLKQVVDAVVNLLRSGNAS
ncbi:MAG: MazF family transcriptional regulator [Nitrospira sp. LK265]|nr:type II toxin-antitoxin system PemK/MazF family toxin [Nitrospira sp.]NGZ59803.1 MazF family transcriptional regulator [Nitrospira sp. LK265]